MVKISQARLQCVFKLRHTLSKALLLHTLSAFPYLIANNFSLLESVQIGFTLKWCVQSALFINLHEFHSGKFLKINKDKNKQRTMSTVEMLH